MTKKVKISDLPVFEAMERLSRLTAAPVRAAA
jgi:hypothetical protein